MEKQRNSERERERESKKRWLKESTPPFTDAPPDGPRFIPSEERVSNDISASTDVNSATRHAHVTEEATVV